MDTKKIVELVQKYVETTVENADKNLAMAAYMYVATKAVGMVTKQLFKN